jgi:hypothetical protein
VPDSIRRFVVLGVLVCAFPAQAGHHQWIISEVFSNADGTVQFVELKGTADNEQFINSFSTTTLGPEGSVASTVPLGPNLPSSATNGAYLLIGTAGYAALATAQGAPAPDRTLPDNFLETTGDRVRYASIAATDRAYGSGGIPTDGILSLDYEVGSPGTTANTPENFAGATGSIDASPAAVPMLSRLGIIGLLGCLVIVFALRLRRGSDASAAA